MKRVGILVPLRNTVAAPFLTTFVAAISELSSLGYLVSVSYNDQVPVDCARQRLMEYAIKLGLTKVLFLDSDMAIPRGVLPVLLESPYDVASALYFEKADGYHPVFRVRGEDGELHKVEKFDPSANPVIFVPAVGLGCCAINTEVVKKLEKPWFLFDWQNDIGEDVYFCNKVEKAGGTIAVYLNLVVGHCGAIIPSTKPSEMV